MRSPRALLLALALILCLCTVAAAPTQVSQLARRQDEGPSQSSQLPSSTPDRSTRRPSPSATPQSTSASSSEKPSSTPEPSPSPSLVPSESSADKVPTTTAKNSPASASESAGKNRNLVLSDAPTLTAPVSQALPNPNSLCSQGSRLPWDSLELSFSCPVWCMH